jgi:uncharacterized protein (TIGR03435 family)
MSYAGLNRGIQFAQAIMGGVMLRSCTLWLICALSSTGSAQAPGALQFEVASIKPNKSDSPVQNVDMQPGGRLTVTNFPLNDMIRLAFGTPQALAPNQLSGGPSWAASDRFDIVAKAEGNPSREQILLMLRTLVTERFKLKVHSETRVLAMYALVLARGDGRLGPRIRLSNIDNIDCSTPSTREQVAPPCQVRQAPASRTGRAVTMAQVARSLVGGVGGLPVLDHTGLAGRFDFDLEWTPDQPLRLPPNAPNLPPIDPNGPSIFTAVKEQLGLKLESTKGPVDVLVIDHAEHPSEN